MYLDVCPMHVRACACARMHVRVLAHMQVCVLHVRAFMGVYVHIRTHMQLITSYNYPSLVTTLMSLKSTLVSTSGSITFKTESTQIGAKIFE